VKRNKQKTLPVLPKYTGVTNDEWNSYAYEFFMPLLSTIPRMTPDVVKATQELSTLAENAQAESQTLHQQRICR
jgi:hypothetical protein